MESGAGPLSSMGYKLHLRIGSRPGNRRRGSTIVEAALGLLVFLALFFGLFDFALPIFVRVSLHHAARAGTRYAITGSTKSGMGHDASIRDVVKRNAFGLLDAADDGKIKINYFDPSGTATTANDPGNMVVVAVEGYQVPRVAPVLWSGPNWDIKVSAADRMEPFPLPAPIR